MGVPEHVRLVRVVAVSPGDVHAERKLLAAVIEELDRRLAPQHGCRLELWRWETDAYPGLHLDGPQGLIDDLMRIDDADLVVGIFWKRFGTPTSDAGSGTEHELRRAWAAWQTRAHPQVMVYFCERKFSPKNALEAAELQKLLSFREAMPKEQLWWTYTTRLNFERAVREHLTAFIQTAHRPTAPTIQPSETGAATEEADRPRTADERGSIRSGAVTFGALAFAGLALATHPSTSEWPTSSLAIAGVVVLAAAFVLSVLELRAAKSSVPVARKRFRGRLAMAIGVVGLMLAVAGVVTRQDRYDASARKADDVPFDRRLGIGPYTVNGTCVNHTCVLYERLAPSAASVRVARLREGQKLTIACQTKGGTVRTRDGSSNVWDRLHDRRTGPYVSDHFVSTPGLGGFTTSIARCPPTKGSAADPQVDGARRR